MSFRSARRDVSLIVVARSVSWLGDALAVVTLTLRLQSSGSGAGAVAALLIANAVPIVVLSAAVGRLVDRCDSRVLLVASSLAQAGLCAVLAAVHSPVAVLALVALLGVGQAVNAATWQALLATVASGDRLPRAVARAQAGTTVAGVVAPALAGLLTGAFSAAVPLLIDGAAYVVVASIAVLIATRRHLRAPADADVRRGGFAIVRADALLAPLLAVLALSVLVGCMVNVVEVFLVRDTLHGSATWYGIGGAVYSVGMFGGALLGGELRRSVAQARVFVVAGILLGGELALLAAMPSVGWLQPVLLAAGAGNGAMNVTLNSLVLARARDAERGRVSAAISGTVSGMQIAAYAAAGALTAALSPRTVFVLAGLLCAIPPVVLARRLVRAAAAPPPVPTRLVSYASTGQL